MFETLLVLPLAFWLVIALLVAAGAWSVLHLRDGVGLPMLTVLGTVAAWYIGDAFYNDYANTHAKLFTAEILSAAWLQVAWFLAVFLLAMPRINVFLNGKHPGRTSGIFKLFERGVDQPFLQKQLNHLFKGCALVWLFLALIALILLGGQVVYFFFPFLGYKTSPWTHDRIGSGFDSLSVIAIYFQLLVAGIFGVVAALSTDRKFRWLAVGFCLVSWPYFIFDRTRNTMLAVVVPGLLSFVFLRLRGGFFKKSLVLGTCFLVVNAWLGFVIANRSSSSITGAFMEKGFDLKENGKVHHEGLNMFEELCWINNFIEAGTYVPNWGGRYFAELVNPIPRGIWPGKPLIGIDYAIARGQGGGGKGAAGVFATISTGFIGQGVVNFGRILGPAFAAIVMCFWVATLARFDLHIQELGRLPLYSLGLILTFNLGRDITFITLYPFVFGASAIWLFDRSQSHKAGESDPNLQQYYRSSETASEISEQAKGRGVFFRRNPLAFTIRKVGFSFRRKTRSKASLIFGTRFGN